MMFILLSMAGVVLGEIFEGDDKIKPFLKPFVIGVSINPGIIVMIETL